MLWYAGLDGPAAARLLDVLPAVELGDRQISSPTMSAFLRSGVAHAGEVELLGYCVGPDRDDERIAVEGIVLARDDLDIAWMDGYDQQRHPDTCQCDEFRRVARDDYGLDDAECGRDEMNVILPRWHGYERRGWRLWRD